RKALQGAVPEPLSTLATVFVRAAPKAQSAMPEKTGPADALDKDALANIVSSLAAHIGPIAEKLVQSQLRKGVSRVQLINNIAAEIADEKARLAFIKKYSEQKSALVEDAGSPAPSSPQSGDASPVSQRFTPAELAKAEADLAQYIGAVARVVVRRAAAKARDVSALYLLLAEQIEDKHDKKAFVRRAISVSGRP
ncbi:MAG: hypothetical protein JF612_14710, partial [Planctomycetia bacterium]|nr:hypothetical protein [Planctomycetia bacterium]